jgi:phosphoenolpyruvate carboxylase
MYLNERDGLFENYKYEFNNEKDVLIKDIKQKVANVTLTESKLHELNQICKDNENYYNTTIADYENTISKLSTNL